MPTIAIIPKSALDGRGFRPIILVIRNGSSVYGFGLDCTILLLRLIILTIIGGKLDPRMAM
ncbi:MAG: hypothetical protein V7K31_10215 [Nostoc sp.]